MRLQSGKLQDIEANIKMLKEDGEIGHFFHRLACPMMLFTPREKWIEILEFEKKQEMERLQFIENVKKR